MTKNSRRMPLARYSSLVRVSITKIPLGVLLIVLSGCRCAETLPSQFLPSVQDPAGVDRSLLTGEPCEPPCWQGLVPGESTTGDVLATLEDLPFADSDSILFSTHEGFENVVWLSSASDLQFAGSIGLHHGRVYHIFIRLEYELTLQELVAAMGEPAGYFVYDSLPPDGVCHTYEIHFVWPEHGLTARLAFQPSSPISQNQQLLPPDMLVVTSADYFQPGASPVEYLVAIGASEETAQEEYERYFQEWQGFDSIVMP
jgi:hypothetical protein